MANASVLRRAGVYLAYLLGAASLVATSREADAQAVVKIGDVTYFKLGILLRAHADWTELANASNTDTDGYQQNLFLRAARVFLAGRITPKVYFFVSTENFNLGKATQAVGATTGTKALGSGFQLVDGLAEWRIDDAFILDGGLLLVPYSRSALMAISSLLSLDVSPYTYLQQTPTQSTGGNRDTGFMARGYFVDHRLEYRLGVFSGARLPGVRNPFRVSGRLQWEFLDTEELWVPAYCAPNVYRGWNFGAKRVLAAGVGFDTQMDYRYYSADLYGSVPAGSLGSLEGILQYQYLDGGVTFPTLPPENTFGADVGFYLKSLKFAPTVRVEQRTFNGQPGKNEWRAGLALSYFVYGTNFNVKAAGIRVMPKTGVATNQFTIQFQVFYF